MIDRLRNTTRQLHKGLEIKLYGPNIINKTLTRAELIHLIQINYIYFSVLYEQRFKHPELAVFFTERHQLAKTDLINMSADIPDEHIIRDNESSKSLLVGMLYVSLGSALGSAMIAKKLTLHPQLKNCSYSFFQNLDGINQMWQSYLLYLSKEITQLDPDEIERGAVQSFKHFDKIYEHTKVTYSRNR